MAYPPSPPSSSSNVSVAELDDSIKEQVQAAVSRLAIKPSSRGQCAGGVAGRLSDCDACPSSTDLLEFWHRTRRAVIFWS